MLLVLQLVVVGDLVGGRVARVRLRRAGGRWIALRGFGAVGGFGVRGLWRESVNWMGFEREGRSLPGWNSVPAAVAGATVEGCAVEVDAGAVWLCPCCCC